VPTLREIETPDGRLILTESALATIVRAAALHCPGVAAVGQGGFPGELRGLLFGEADAGGSAGVEMELDAEHLEVTVDIAIFYGAHIPQVVAAVVAAVTADLEDQAGIRPNRLLVRVQGVRPRARPDRRPEDAGDPGGD
jgi:uncharacterized alkaline shock family protein YloU